MKESNYSSNRPRDYDEEIIFFDELGFGWVVDSKIIEEIHANPSNQQDTIVEKTLGDLLKPEY